MNTAKRISLVQKHRTLNPVLLGRPLQAFEAISQHLVQRVIEQMQKTGHRNITLTIGDAHFEPQQLAQQGQHTACEVQISRSSVQDWMTLRYGFTQQSNECHTQLPPPSATEKRITLHLQEAIAQAVALVFPNTDAMPTPAEQQLWRWSGQLQIDSQTPAPLSILLSATQSACLEAWVAQQRKPARSATHQGQPLLIDLQALLLEKTVSAADIYQLRIGSVVPIALDRAVVNLNGQPMLSASVAEHQGKLHLTAFETLE